MHLWSQSLVSQLIECDMMFFGILIAEQHRMDMSISKIYGLTPKKIIKHSTPKREGVPNLFCLSVC